MSLIPKKGTVYVVDDDEAVRDSLQWLLEGKDYRVRCFESAESFLSRYDPREVACLIVDIRMGGMTGLELIRTLENPPLFILVTSKGEYALEGFDLRVADFIVKPVTMPRSWPFSTARMRRTHSWRMRMESLSSAPIWSICSFRAIASLSFLCIPVGSVRHRRYSLPHTSIPRLPPIWSRRYASKC